MRLARSKEADDSPRAATLDMRISDVIAKQPEHDYAIARCLEAWGDLSTCRGIGMAAGPIPWTAIVAWTEFHDLDPDAAMQLIHVIRQLDNDRAERIAAEQRLAKQNGGKS